MENIGAGTYTLKVEATADCFYTKEITLTDGTDTEAPEITCPDDQKLNPGENLKDYTSLAVVSDNCDSDVSVSQSPEAGTEFTEETTVTLTAEDASGNTKACTFIIEVTPDTEAPELTCPDNQELACDATVIPDYTDLVSVSDNRDSSPEVTQSPAARSPFTAGMTISIKAKDEAGNESTCEFLVNLEEDTESPAIECPDDQELIPGENLKDYTSLAIVSDNCDSDVSVSQSPEAGTEFTEETTVTLTAEDASGNSKTCTFVIEVTPDTEAPELTCPDNQELACDATVIPDYTDLVSVSDNRDTSPEVTQSPVAGSPFTAGMTISIKAKDEAGNESTCEFLVNLAADTESPVIECPEDQELIPGENLKDYTSLTVVSDNCDSDVSVSQSPEAGTEFTEETTVTLTAEDASGNTKICTFIIEVTPDTEAPELTCPDNQSLACDATEIPDYTDLVSVSDNRDASPIITQSPEAGSEYTAGMTITISAEDESGNVSSCDFVVNSEEDTESPTLSCLAPQTVTIGGSLADYTSLVTVEDNCDAEPTVSQSVAPGTEITEDITITITAEDASGNIENCEIEIIATSEPDTEAPEITCPDDQFLACGATEIQDYTDLVSVSDDRDPNPIITQSPEAGSEFTEGMSITISAEDESGNVSSCDFVVNREEDTESPTISCLAPQTITIGGSLADYTSLVTVEDNCDAEPIVSQSVAPGTEITEDISITITAEDASGNIENCEIEIIATSDADTEAPEITCPEDQVLACGATEIPDYTGLVSVSDDRDPNPIITQSPEAGSGFTEGMTITISAEDESGNVSSCDFVVNSEEDTESPSLSCLAPQTITIGGSLADYTSLVTVDDNCDAEPTVSQSVAPGTEITEDITITITAEDASGNIENCEIEIIATSDADTEAPEISCPEDQVLACGATEIPDYTGLISVSDDRDPNPIITQSPEAGSEYTEGMTITITAQDNSGNTSTCTFQVSAEGDNLNSLTCPEEQEISLNENCEAVLPDFRDLVKVDASCSSIESINQFPEPGSVINEDSEVIIEVVDQSGNKTSCNFNLKIIGEGIPQIEVGEDVEINLGESVELSAESSSDGSYKWFPARGLSNTTISNPIASPDKSTTYTVIFTNSFGCSIESEITVNVEEGVQVAKGFSPDNDGINEIWKIEGIEEYRNNEVVIYNRWGNIVFAIKGYDNQYNVFDGNANRNTSLGGGQLPEGTYFYKIRFAEGHSDLEGFLVLKR
ncbi:HYR domain-containing protein [Marivirga salinae]|uniref:HYR domain-containing protein n=1 Tax=Marivirga salinarum TaxID=3059078 RepID=A0AA51N9B9_9BACT|nr:HYR domain-containing protein [Marivirga sp. BDSF4-3]WMN10943.1 HYR domain-containing protein [Marivirga sp. BDSF4-3]